MRMRLGHLLEPWMPAAGCAALFIDGFGRTTVTGWASVSGWTGWLLVAVFLFCRFQFIAHHDMETCSRCPQADPAGKHAAQRSRWALWLLHSLTPVALLVHRLGGGPRVLAAVLFAAFVIAPILLIGWIAPDGFALACILAYFTVFYMSAYRHRQLGRWCPWCRHGGGGGDDGDDHPDPEPEPVPSNKRDLTLAA